MGKAAKQSAGRKRQEMNDIVMLETERWGRPGTDREARWLADLLDMPSVQVRRLDDDVLLAQGMEPKRCHVNCNRMAYEDLTGETEHVPGWWVAGPALLLHSVVKVRGEHWACITPQLLPAPQVFEFIPDPELQLVPNMLGSFELRRHGEEIPVGLRAYPEKHVEMHQAFLALLAQGKDPMEAHEELSRTIGATIMDLPLRRYV